MAYLVKKSRKRGGAYKKSRYAKRRMTGGEDYPNKFREGDHFFACNADKTCCQWGNYPGTPKNKEWDVYEKVKKHGNECKRYANISFPS